MSDKETKPSPAYDPKMPPAKGIWTAREKAILNKHYEQFAETDSNKRSAFLKDVPGEEIRALTSQFKKEGLTPKNKVLWDNKMKQMKGWFYTKWNKDPSRNRKLTIPGLEVKTNFAQVLSLVKKKEIVAEAQRTAEAEGYDKNNNGRELWFPYYAGAKKVVKENLSEEEKEALEQMVEEWQNEVPREVQIQNCAKKGHQIVTRMDKIRCQTLGMKTMWFEYHYGPNGIVLSASDSKICENDTSGLPSFQEWDKETYKLMFTKWNEYVEHIRDLETNPGKVSQAADVTRFKDKELKFTKTGLPTVPGKVENKNHNETHDIRVDIIRAILRKHYDLAGGSGRVPYTDMLTLFVPWSFTDPEYFPSIPFKEPAKYSHNESKALIAHWRDRQEEGKIPFLWTHILVKKRKVKAAYKPHMLEGKPALSIDKVDDSAISEMEPESRDETVNRIKPKPGLVASDNEDNLDRPVLKRLTKGHRPTKDSEESSEEERGSDSSTDLDKTDRRKSTVSKSTSSKTQVRKEKSVRFTEFTPKSMKEELDNHPDFSKALDFGPDKLGKQKSSKVSHSTTEDSTGEILAKKKKSKQGLVHPLDDTPASTNPTPTKTNSNADSDTVATTKGLASSKKRSINAGDGISQATGGTIAGLETEGPPNKRRKMDGIREPAPPSPQSNLAAPIVPEKRKIRPIPLEKVKGTGEVETPKSTSEGITASPATKVASKVVSAGIPPQAANESGPRRSGRAPVPRKLMDF